MRRAAFLAGAPSAAFMAMSFCLLLVHGRKAALAVALVLVLICHSGSYLCRSLVMDELLGPTCSGLLG